MTKTQIVDELVKLYADPTIPLSIAANIFAFKYGGDVIGTYSPNELLLEAHNQNNTIDPNEDGELNAAFLLYDYLKKDPCILSGLTKKSICKHPEDKPFQLIVYGAPGTGKSFELHNKWTARDGKSTVKVFRTTFHPDSDYSTFVGAYKPTQTDEKITYDFRPQAFIKAYVKAWQVMAGADDADGIKEVVLLIEEINRGNCAQIFGDVFQLLDRGSTGYSTYPIEADVDLAAWLAKDNQFGKKLLGLKRPEEIKEDADWKEILNGTKLALPPNLYIWATMNTSDQSLFPIDSAFKRRWEWKYIPIRDKGEKYKIKVGADRFEWWPFLKKINEIVQQITESEDKKLGYYFCKPAAGDEITLKQFVGKVVFYLWNEVFKDVIEADEYKDIFKGGEDGKLYFRSFFDENGNPKESAVKQLMNNLGIKTIDEENKSGSKGMGVDATTSETVQ